MAISSIPIRLKPKNFAGYYGRGTTLAMMQDWDKAIFDFTEAMQLEPNEADLYYGRAECYLKKGAKEKADADLKRAKELDPDPNV